MTYGYYYNILRGGFRVARFDNQGNAKAFTQWNGRQDWLHVFYVCETKIENPLQKGAKAGHLW